MSIEKNIGFIFWRNLFFMSLMFLGTFLFIKPIRAANFGDVLINEVAWMGGTESGSDEWIELKNNTEQDINLSNWFLKAEDGTPFIKLATITLEAGDYYLLERTDDNSVSGIVANQIYSGALEDGGENLQLLDNEGQVIDEIVASGGWPSGSGENKLTMERTNSGGWQNSSLVDGTPKALNSNGPVVEDLAGACSTVVINELLANPIGVDDDEWIELKNLSTSTVSLIGWQISDLSGSKYIVAVGDFSTTTIAANGFFILPKNITGISLNNSGEETVRLYNAQNILQSETRYTGSVAEEIVWARDGEGMWQWTTVLTAGGENIIVVPVAHSYGGGASVNVVSYPKNFKINEIMPNPKGLDEGVTNLILNQGVFDKERVLLGQIKIEDWGEWIEIKSFEGEAFPLTGWKIKSQTGEYIIQEKDFKWPYLEAGGYFLIPRAVSKLSLKNSGGEEIQLINPAGEVVDKVKYSGEADEGLSYMLMQATDYDKNNQWFWTTTLTPALENIYTKNNLRPKPFFEVIGEIQPNLEVILDASESYDPEGEDLVYEWHFSETVDFDGVPTTTIKSLERVIKIRLKDVAKLKIGLRVLDPLGADDEQSQNIKPEVVKKFWWEENTTEEINKSSVVVKTTTGVSNFKVVDIKDLPNLADGQKVAVKGVVAVEPGTLGVNIFYLAGSGIQIYCYKKDFPALAIGDVIEVKGELGTAYGERRIKITDRNSIKVVSGGEPPGAEEFFLSELEESLVGSLIKIKGEITSVKKDLWWLDDGSDEIRVVIKPSTDFALQDFVINPGDLAEVTGVLSLTSAGLRILPRGASDVRVEKVLGESVQKESWTAKIFSEQFLKYWLVFCLTIIIILGVILYKTRCLLPKK